MGYSQPSLVRMVQQCLNNVPGRRPSSVELLVQVQRVREEMEGVFGESVVDQLDVGKVLLIKELKMQEKRVEEVEVCDRESSTNPHALLNLRMLAINFFTLTQKHRYIGPIIHTLHK